MATVLIKIVHIVRIMRFPANKKRRRRSVIVIDYKDRRPIYEQIMAGIEDLAARGALSPDSQLPSVRQLAMELSINPNTI